MTGLLSPLRAAAATSSRGLGITRLQQLADQLSRRDLAVLTSVSNHRFLTTNHIEQLHFMSHASALSGARTARRVLRRLLGLRLVAVLPRRVGGLPAGSTPAVWHLPVAGQRLLALATASAADVVDSGVLRVREPSLRFVAHCLAVADAHCTLVREARRGSFQLSAVSCEPDCWRRFTGQYGQPEILRPDLAITTRSADGEYEDRWFLEVDLGTEHLPTVLTKCAQYDIYRASGSEQRNHGVFPLVVWVTMNQQRAAKLTVAIRGARNLDTGLYRVVAATDLGAAVAGGAGADDGQTGDQA